MSEIFYGWITMKLTHFGYACFLGAAVISPPAHAESNNNYQHNIKRIVNKAAVKLIKKYHIPGMAIAIISQGRPHYFTYGVIDIDKKIPVTGDSLFEIGSISKTLTGALGGDSLARGEITLSDSPLHYWPNLYAKKWRSINLLQLATYTAGGLPPKIPPTITDTQQLTEFYNRWQPLWNPGDIRLYADSSIALFGAIAAKPSGLPFEEALYKRVLRPLNMLHTWIKVPEQARSHYAWGYRDKSAVRLTPGILAAASHGLKSTVQDMAVWIQANIDPEVVVPTTLKRGITLSQQRYTRIGSMYQGLGWDIFNWPAESCMVIYCSERRMANEPQVSVLINPPAPAVKSSWVHKTGSTPGFASYVAFIPEKKIGIVVLANKNYPIADRINLAYFILRQLD